MQHVFDAVLCSVCQKCVPIHKTNVNKLGNARSCVGCETTQYQEEPLIYCSTTDTPRWVDAIGIVSFDLLLGQVMEVLHPPLPLSQVQETEVSFLCFPDANHVADGDSIHDFVFAYNLSECDDSRTTTRRAKSDSAIATLPVSPRGLTSATDSLTPVKIGYDSTSTELFCSTLFRQKKDASIQRGAQQKALLVMSRYPFPSVAHQILRILCAATFDTPAADLVEVVTRAYEDICKWPAPLPTHAYRLQLLGQELSPYTTPVYFAADVERLKWSETLVRSGRGGEIRKNLVDALTARDASWETVEGPLAQFLMSAGCSPATRAEIETIVLNVNKADCGREILVELLRKLLVGCHARKDTAAKSDHGSSAHSASRGAQLQDLLRHFRYQSRPLMLADVVDVVNEALEQLQARAHGILTSPDLVSAECKHSGPQRGRHLFHEMELHHALYPHLPKLWKLWELLIVGEPLCVLSYDAPTVTATCTSLAALIAPLHYAGVLRPYVTINNREVDLFIKDPALPSVLFGTTNPFFVRRCSKWPHILCLSKDNDEPRTHKMLPADSEKREKQQFKLKNRMFCSRHYLIKTEKSLEEVTGTASVVPPNGKSSFVDLNPTSTEGQAMRQLRQHFADLTEEFLAPLRAIIRDTLRKERPFFLPQYETERLVGVDALLKSLGQYTGPLPQTVFKNRVDMLTVYRDFLRTNSFVVFFQSEYEFALREVLLSASSLEEILLMNPDCGTRHDVLQALQEEFERVLSRPIVDLSLCQKLSALCSLIPSLRQQLSLALGSSHTGKE